jgi:hypothetical protein
MLSSNYEAVAIKEVENNFQAVDVDVAVDDDEYVTVCAPANLPGGYELNVDFDGASWTVQVVRLLLFSFTVFCNHSFCFGS